MGWGSAILPILGAAGAGQARGKFNRQQLDRQEMMQALGIEAQQRRDERENRGLEYEGRRLENQDRDRRDVWKFRIDDAAERGKDRDADREARRQTAREASADRDESRAARKEARELRPDERESAADEFAYRMVSAANGDPRVAQNHGARDMVTARKLGLRRDHYYAAAQRFKDRLTAKTKPSTDDDYGEAPPQAGKVPAPAGPKYSSVPEIKRAQEMWDSSPVLQQKRKRPE